MKWETPKMEYKVGDVAWLKIRFLEANNFGDTYAYIETPQGRQFDILKKDLHPAPEVASKSEIAEFIDDWNDNEFNLTGEYPIEPTDIDELAKALVGKVAKPAEPQYCECKEPYFNPKGYGAIGALPIIRCLHCGKVISEIKHPRPTPQRQKIDIPSDMAIIDEYLPHERTMRLYMNSVLSILRQLAGEIQKIERGEK